MTYTHVAAGIVCGALAAIGTWQVQAWRYDTRMAIMQQAHAEALQRSEQMARQREQGLVRARQEAEESYVQEKRKAAVAAGRARAELDGLREQLYAISAPQRRQDPAPARRVDAGAVERELLGQCAANLVDLAAEADRLAVQLTGLQGYVRQVCVAP